MDKNKENFKNYDDNSGSNLANSEKNREQENQKHDISKQETENLEKSGNDLTSDESINSGLLDDEDTEGIPLNEGPDDDHLFDVGEELDVRPDDLNPDLDNEKD